MHIPRVTPFPEPQPEPDSTPAPEDHEASFEDTGECHDGVVPFHDDGDSGW